MRRLVALDLPGGDAFVAALQRCLDDGDAAFPLDQRLPDAARHRLLEAMAPAIVRHAGGDSALAGGIDVEDGDALVVATSGTTGEPRGAVLTRAALEAAARVTSVHLGVDAGSDRWLACLPLSHVGGLGVVLRALFTGTAVEVHAGFDHERVTEAAKAGASLVSLVPTALGRLGAATAAAFRVILLGGSAIPTERPANAVATYGMTETGGGVIYDGVALAGVEVAIRAGGEIALRCPMLLRCYRDGNDPKDATGWFSTGDCGELGTDGTLRVHGRIGDVVVTGGEKVWPTSVEASLARHPLVAEVAVAGRPDPEWGERVVAFVVPRRLDEPPSLETLRRHVTAELGAISAPKELELVSELPRTALGKVRRGELGAMSSAS